MVDARARGEPAAGEAEVRVAGPDAEGGAGGGMEEGGAPALANVDEREREEEAVVVGLRIGLFPLAAGPADGFMIASENEFCKPIRISESVTCIGHQFVRSY